MIVGQGYDGTVNEAYRWTQAGGVVGLCFIGRTQPGTGYVSTALGVSGDGATVVGGSLAVEARLSPAGF